MKFSHSLLGLLSLLFLFNSVAHATVSHTATVELDLIQVDEKGHEHSIENSSSDFSLDWSTKKCEIKLNKQFVYCNLDTSQDITDSKGELVMKSVPQAHFEGGMMDALIRTMGLNDRSVKKIISRVVNDTRSQRAKGFDLPFYSNEEILWNAYQGSVTRDLVIQHSYLGRKKLILRMKIKGMKAYGGAFNIIGNSNAASYGH